jgi:hypothetical protein
MGLLAAGLGGAGRGLFLFAGYWFRSAALLLVVLWGVRFGCDVV